MNGTKVAVPQDDHLLIASGVLFQPLERGRFRVDLVKELGNLEKLGMKLKGMRTELEM